jgi:hypothetical protein
VLQRVALKPRGQSERDEKSLERMPRSRQASLAISSQARLNRFGRARSSGSAGPQRLHACNCIPGSRPMYSVACWRNNASGIVALVVASGYEFQAKHGLEFVPAVFAHILLVDGVRAYRTSPIVTFSDSRAGQRTTPSSTVRFCHSSEDSTNVSPG